MLKRDCLSGIKKYFVILKHKHFLNNKNKEL
jgi:hypothetical protein